VTSDWGALSGAKRHASSVTVHPVAIVAGEASGDLLGALLIDALQRYGLASAFEGIAGPRMQALGAHSLFPMEILSVRGYVEALANLRQILAIRRRIGSHFLNRPPPLFIGVDAPDFNLGLAERLKKGGIPTVHFVSPSIWAWRRERIEKIRRAVDHVLLIFPFEAAIYADAGIPATYVGHPLARSLPARPDRDGARQRLGLDTAATYIALLPGSRSSEVSGLARTYLDTVRRMHAARPELRFLVPLVNAETHRLFVTALAEVEGERLPLSLIDGQAHDVMQAADLALIASGTASLEALLLGCPHVITYRVPWLTYQIMKRQAYLPWVGLPNILAGRDIVPELLQDAAEPGRIAATLLDLLDDADARATMRTAFSAIRADLERDTPRLIAEALAPFLPAPAS